MAKLIDQLLGTALGKKKAESYHGSIMREAKKSFLDPLQDKVDKLQDNIDATADNIVRIGCSGEAEIVASRDEAKQAAILALKATVELELVEMKLKVAKKAFTDMFGKGTA